MIMLLVVKAGAGFHSPISSDLIVTDWAKKYTIVCTKGLTFYLLPETLFCVIIMLTSEIRDS